MMESAFAGSEKVICGAVKVVQEIMIWDLLIYTEQMKQKTGT